MRKYQYSQNLLVLSLVIYGFIGLIFLATPLKFITFLIIILMFFTIAAYLTTSVVIQNDSITLKTGVLSHKVTEIPINKISGIDIRMSLLGRLMNYGNITITSSNDVSGIKLKGINHPEDIRQALKSTEDNTQ